MGKSDPLIFKAYLDMLPWKNYSKVAFLGFADENAFTKCIPGKERHFFDLQLKNWDINDDSWRLESDYDLVISTRCPYFAKDPSLFIERCLGMVKRGGVLFLDWGFGDHWRYENYKIGWVKDGEHESAYEDGNYLWSGVWHDSFLSNSAYKEFEEWVAKFGYDDVKSAIFDETPSILNLNKQPQWMSDVKMSYNLITLWEESPQLYVLILINK